MRGDALIAGKRAARRVGGRRLRAVAHSAAARAAPHARRAVAGWRPAERADSSELAALLSPPPPPPAASALGSDPVVICPAQFGTASDYADLSAQLEARGHPTSVAPLKRFDWFRLIPAALSEDYLKGELKPENA
eukprot:2125306-Prymnesium_polylepis.2